MATRTSSGTQIVLRPQQSTGIRRRSSSGGGRSRRSSNVRQRIANLRRRAVSSGEETKLAACTIGAPVVAGLLEKHAGFTLPTVGGIHPNLLWGGVATLFGKKIFGNGETGRMVRAAGLGLAASAASEVTATGTPITSAAAGRKAKAAQTAAAKKKAKKKGQKVAGDDEVGDDYDVGDDEVGDDEVGDDEVGDDEVGDDEIGDDDY